MGMSLPEWEAAFPGVTPPVETLRNMSRSVDDTCVELIEEQIVEPWATGCVELVDCLQAPSQSYDPVTSDDVQQAAAASTAIGDVILLVGGDSVGAVTLSHDFHPNSMALLAAGVLYPFAEEANKAHNYYVADMCSCNPLSYDPDAVVTDQYAPAVCDWDGISAANAQRLSATLRTTLSETQSLDVILSMEESLMTVANTQPSVLAAMQQELTRGSIAPRVLYIYRNLKDVALARYKSDVRTNYVSSSFEERMAECGVSCQITVHRERLELLFTTFGERQVTMLSYEGVMADSTVSLASAALEAMDLPAVPLSVPTDVTTEATLLRSMEISNRRIWQSFGDWMAETYSCTLIWPVDSFNANYSAIDPMWEVIAYAAQQICTDLTQFDSLVLDYDDEVQAQYGSAIVRADRTAFESAIVAAGTEFCEIDAANLAKKCARTSSSCIKTFKKIYRRLPEGACPGAVLAHREKLYEDYDLSTAAQVDCRSRASERPFNGTAVQFVHVPKTGGTALVRSIKSSLKHEHVYELNEYTGALCRIGASEFGACKRKVKQVSTQDFFHGHAPIEFGAFWVRPLYITILREPVANLMSQVAYSYFFCDRQKRSPEAGEDAQCQPGRYFTQLGVEMHRLIAAGHPRNGVLQALLSNETWANERSLCPDCTDVPWQTSFPPLSASFFTPFALRTEPVARLSDSTVMRRAVRNLQQVDIVATTESHCDLFVQLRYHAPHLTWAEGEMKNSDTTDPAEIQLIEMETRRRLMDVPKMRANYDLYQVASSISEAKVKHIQACSSKTCDSKCSILGSELGESADERRRRVFEMGVQTQSRCVQPAPKAFAMQSALAKPLQYLSDPHAKRAAAWSAEQRATTCGPRSEDFWVISTGHKTGTELMDHVASVIVGQGVSFSAHNTNVQGACFGSPDHRLQRWRARAGSDYGRLLSPACLEALSEAQTHNVLLHRGGPMNKTSVATAIRTLAAQPRHSRHQLRVLLSVREPVEIIKSAYFYHADGAEPVQREKPSVWVEELHRICRHEQLRFGIPLKLPETVCHAILQHTASVTSYAELLQRLPPHHGILAQAASSYLHGLHLVEDAPAAAAAFPSVATTLDLADILDDFDAAFGSAFKFLGVADADVGACLASIRHLDVSRTLRSSTSHEACVADNARAEDLQRYQKLREQLRAPNGHVFNNAAWYAEYIEPLRALTPDMCFDQHVADTTLDGLKRELDRFLRASKFYASYIRPLESSYNDSRALMGKAVRPAPSHAFDVAFNRAERSSQSSRTALSDPETGKISS
jgi:hypothetical protein